MSRRIFAVLAGMLTMTSCWSSVPPPPEGSNTMTFTEGAVILGPGERHDVDVVATDSQGRPVPAPEGTWSTDDPTVAAVNADGTVSGLQLGSTRLRYRAGERETAVNVTVARVAPGIQRLSAEQVKAAPTPLEATAALLAGAQFRVILNGTRVQVGQLIMSEGEPFFAGRVIAVEQQGTAQMVTFERTRPGEIFTAYDFHVSGRLPAGEAVPVASALGRRVGPDGATYLKFNVQAVKALAEKEFPLGPFTCTATTDIVLNPSSIEVKLQNVVDFDLVVRDDEQGNSRVRFKNSGQLNGTLTGGLKIGANFTGKLECKKPDLVSIPIPVSGPLAFFVSPVLSLGFTVSASGAFGVGAADLGFQGAAKANLDLGFEYTDQNGLTNLSTIGGSADLVPRLVYTGTPEATLKAELFAGPTASLGLGNSLIHADLLALSLGPVLEGDFASTAYQVADATYGSGYNLRLQGKVEPGDSIGKFIKYAVSKVSKEIKESALALTFEAPLSVSPTGGAEASTSEFKAGDEISVKAVLDPANTHFLGLYNVDAVEVYRRVSSESGAKQAVLLASQPAANGQETFVLTWKAQEDGKLGDDYFLFVRSSLLPFLPLEVAGVQGNPLSIEPKDKVVQINEEVQFKAQLGEKPAAAITWSATGGTIDASGLFRSAAPGTFKVTAKDAEGHSATVSISVHELEIRPAPTKLKPGEQVQFTAYLDGKATEDVGWSSTGGSITSKGLLTAPNDTGTYTVEVRLRKEPEVKAEHRYKVGSQNGRVTLRFNVVKRNVTEVTEPVWIDERHNPFTGGTTTATTINEERWLGVTSFEGRLDHQEAWYAVSLLDSDVKHIVKEDFSSRSDITARCYRRRDNEWGWDPLAFSVSRESHKNSFTQHFASGQAIYRVLDDEQGNARLEIVLPKESRWGKLKLTQNWTYSGSRYFDSGYPFYCNPNMPPNGTKETEIDVRYEIPTSKTLIVPLKDFQNADSWTVTIPAEDIGYALGLDGLSGDLEITVERK